MGGGWGNWPKKRVVWLQPGQPAPIIGRNNKNKSMLKGMQKKHARADFSRSRGLCSVWASFSDRSLNLNILIAVSRNSLSLLPQLSSWIESNIVQSRRRYGTSCKQWRSLARRNHSVAHRTCTLNWRNTIIHPTAEHYCLINETVLLKGFSNNYRKVQNKSVIGIKHTQLMVIYTKMAWKWKKKKTRIKSDEYVIFNTY